MRGNSMPTRKEMKRKARRALKRHYIMYVAICLIAAYVGSVFTSSLNVLDVTPASGSYHTEERLERPSGINEGFADVMYDMLAGDEEDRKALSEELKAEEIERSRTGNPAFGRSRGVLASLVNSVTSGSIVVSMLAALHSLTGSENLAILIFILLGAAFLFSIWFFFVNIFKVISRRVFLEGRVYEKVPFQRMLFLLRVKKWTKVSCTMFLASLYQLLWSLTIVGGFVKYFSYYLVPYIAAENPDIAPGEAIRLSRRMMKGHKWECFVFEMSFFPWLLLGGATFGISEILYSNPYRAAFFSEYYADMRAEAKKAHLKGSELLNDTYLYEMPEDELIYSLPVVLAQRVKICKASRIFFRQRGFRRGNSHQLIERDIQYLAQPGNDIQRRPIAAFFPSANRVPGTTKLPGDVKLIQARFQAVFADHPSHSDAFLYFRDRPSSHAFIFYLFFHSFYSLRSWLSTAVTLCSIVLADVDIISHKNVNVKH